MSVKSDYDTTQREVSIQIKIIFLKFASFPAKKIVQFAAFLNQLQVRWLYIPTSNVPNFVERCS